MDDRSYTVKAYSASQKDAWNAFIREAKNGTFLFNRNFMDYHADRFIDHSLMVYDGSKLSALFPANINNGVLHSHQGLSYGGLLLSDQIKFTEVLGILRALLKHVNDLGIHRLIVKQVPRIYHKRPSDEVDYLLHILNARLIRRDSSTVIPLSNKMSYSNLRKRQLKKGRDSGLTVIREKDLSAFWNDILIPNLRETHGVSPVHSLEEITGLAAAFPDNIKQFNAYRGGQLLSGCTVFETETAAHLQYISTRKSDHDGALDYLIDYLITQEFQDKAYFDFGISNINEGRNINAGLLRWKEGFGGSVLVNDFYEIDPANHKRLNEVLL